MRQLATSSMLLSLLLFALAGPVHAQRVVTGTVVDAETEEPLPGVNIVVQGTTVGTITDLDGEYSIEVPGPDAVLVYTFIGYEQQEFRVGDQQVINVTLEERVTELEDVVVVGYGTQRREDVTASVSTVDADDANLGLVTSPDQLIQGRVAGVNIVQNNGEPGAGFQIRIRGGTSISASNDPLYVIDGVPIDNAPITPGGTEVSSSAPRNPLNLLNPNDIESITILKDASATAIYGSRGANGVILIQTKQGLAGQLTVDYEGYVAASTMYEELDVLAADEYREFVAQHVLAGNLNPSAFENIGPAATNWQEEVTQTAVTQFHNLAFSGGTLATRYRASVSYLNQPGIIIDSGLERLTGRVNASHETFNERLTLGINLQGAFTEDDHLPYEQTGGFEGGVFTNVFGFNPTQPVSVDIDGDGIEDDFYEVGPGSQSIRNPVALSRQIDDFSKTTRLLGNLSAELEVTEELTAQVNVGADRSQASRRAFFPNANPVGAIFGGLAMQRDRERSSVTLQTYLTYNDQIGGAHNFDVLGGYEFNEYLFEEFGAEARGFVSDLFNFNALEAGSELIKPYSDKWTSRLISFFTRANYNYRNRYYLTGVLRYDGSSRFGSGNKWALFPAVSGAWRISEEDFMDGFDAVSDLRLRAGFGIVGSQEIENYLSLAQLGADPGSRAIIGGEVITGVAPINYANPELRWEETASFNIGLDYGFLNNKFSGSIEYYLKNTYDLLLKIPVPQPAPVPERVENVGELRNQGIEFSLDALALDRDDLSVLLGIVFAANQNEVVSLGPRDRIVFGDVSGRGQSDVFGQIITPGEPIGTFYGPVFAGVDRVTGEQLFYDLDEDGNIIGTTPDPGGDDRAVIGNAQPDFTYGFRSQAYMGSWDFSLFLRGEQGRDIFNNTALVNESVSAVLQNNNFFTGALDDPSALAEAPVFSSRWIEDGSFLRLDNVTLGYTFDLTRMTSYAKNARVYLSANNLLVLTPYSGFDPEVNTDATPDDEIPTLGFDYTNYPRPRTFTLGVHLAF